MFRIDLICDSPSCPAYKRCCFLPTECYENKEGKIDVLFVGQGGGQDERKKKRPFCGKAGKRLRQLVVYLRSKLGIHFGVAFSNTIRDNPEDNRPPDYDELLCCLPYLYKDIVALKDKGLKCVIPLGNPSKTALIKSSQSSMEKDHGKIFNVKNDVFGDILMIPTYHPSYLCRNHQVWHPEKPGAFELLALADIEKAVLL